MKTALLCILSLLIGFVLYPLLMPSGVSLTTHIENFIFKFVLRHHPKTSEWLQRYETWRDNLRTTFFPPNDHPTRGSTGPKLKNKIIDKVSKVWTRAKEASKKEQPVAT